MASSSPALCAILAAPETANRRHDYDETNHSPNAAQQNYDNEKCPSTQKANACHAFEMEDNQGG